MKTVGERVAFCRREKGWSQPRLADEVRRANPKLKTTQSTIHSIESGGSKKPTILYEIAQALGVNATWLKTGAGPQISAESDQAIDVNELFDHVFEVVAGSYEAIGLPPDEAAALAQLVREVAEEPLARAESPDAQDRRRTLGEFVAHKFLKAKHFRPFRA